MPRIFLGLACGLLLVLLAAAGVGLWSPGKRPDPHIILAVFALLLACLIQVIVFTYLTVTGKMVTQVLHLAHADLSPMKTVKSIKREATYLVGLMILGTVPVVATGALTWRTHDGQELHLMLAFVSLACHGFVLFREFDLVTRNSRLVDGVLKQHRIANAGSKSDGTMIRARDGVVQD
ncbi:MAG: hypothetical protein O7B25_02565 [Gammaproteobacteria bacterium]|nr:hypothetical protein [Gammaproteobacteria bacterium]